MKSRLFSTSRARLSGVGALALTWLSLSSMITPKTEKVPPYEGRYQTGVCGTYDPSTGDITYGAGCIYEDPDGNCRRYSACVPH
ncbi:MAG: hypothetical protein EOO42_21815 [Flavobacteriales bacterium]|nr:MAG: hypothetical protein EOO42_21815 [Flavobacteriales bacterium]